MGATPITFAGGVLDRGGEHRADADWIAAAIANPDARALVLGPHGILLDGPPPSDWLDDWEARGEQSLTPVRVPLAGRSAPVLLGLSDGAPLFAVEAVDGESLVDLRGAAPMMTPADAGLLAYAQGITHWHRTHRFCSICAQPTEAREGGHMRACENGHQHHPRTDPVVIMLVCDGDRVLMGRQPSWPPHRYSALAGFVEPGEALEAAVAREVHEEAGITVGAVRYIASQPWPFPASLMLGFEADAEPAGQTPQADEHELEDCRWFTRAEVEAAKRGEGELKLPPSMAIARHLVENWLRGR